MAMMIVIDGRTMEESINMNRDMFTALTGKEISDDEIKTVMEMQPNTVTCKGFTYERSIDGTVKFVITDEGIHKVNAFTRAWTPAIAGAAFMFKSQLKSLKKLFKKFIEAHKNVIASLKADMKIDGMTEDKWVEESAKKWSNHFDDVLKSKPGKTIEEKIDELNKYQEELVDGKTKFKLGTTEFLDEMVRVAKELGELKAEYAAQKAKAE